MPPPYPRWRYFPAHAAPPDWVAPLIALFAAVRDQIDSAVTFEKRMESNDVLRVEEGSLYPALHRLEEANLVKAQWTVTSKNRRARVYEVTPDGLRQLEREEQRWRTLTLAVGRLLEEI